MAERWKKKEEKRKKTVCGFEVETINRFMILLIMNGNTATMNKKKQQQQIYATVYNNK